MTAPAGPFFGNVPAAPKANFGGFFSDLAGPTSSLMQGVLAVQKQQEEEAYRQAVLAAQATQEQGRERRHGEEIDVARERGDTERERLLFERDRPRGAAGLTFEQLRELERMRSERGTATERREEDRTKMGEIALRTRTLLQNGVRPTFDEMKKAFPELDDSQIRVAMQQGQADTQEIGTLAEGVIPGDIKPDYGLVTLPFDAKSPTFQRFKEEATDGEILQAAQEYQAFVAAGMSEEDAMNKAWADALGRFLNRLTPTEGPVEAYEAPAEQEVSPFGTTGVIGGAS
jgi:hypothetical protein